MGDSGADIIERLVLDTSAYSHFRAGHPLALDAIASAVAVVIPVTVLGELVAALEMGSRTRENRSVLREFLAEPFVTVVDTTRSVAERYGRLFADLRGAGTPIPANDIWIAATALVVEGHLLTFDADFRHVKGLSATILAAA